MFEGNADAALQLYSTVFPDLQITQMQRYGPGQPGREGTIVRADFKCAGQNLICIDSPIHHAFTFTPSMSLFVEFNSEADLDEAFAKLSEGGSVLMPPANYGFSSKFTWVNDRFGVSWQLNFQ
jgi:predicted 3-demethylubiquinone-9 3-methyltransferase (glyoxalase superfamily)